MYKTSLANDQYKFLAIHGCIYTNDWIIVEVDKVIDLFYVGEHAEDKFLLRKLSENRYWFWPKVGHSICSSNKRVKTLVP